MNSFAHNSTSGVGREAVSGSAEATLRLIASLPAPRGIEDRVMAGLKNFPRTGRILHWRSTFQPSGSWMRSAAAAAIVFVVAGGGWGIYTRVPPGQPAKVIVMPRVGAGGGFSSAGAMRTPQTVNGPVVAEPVKGQTQNPRESGLLPAQVKPLKKVPARIVPMPKGQTQADAGKKASVHTAAQAVR